ncbi:hypothetical protein U3516DRAFT_771594 [Neocallimastix sp. 'constans']
MRRVDERSSNFFVFTYFIFLLGWLFLTVLDACHNNGICLGRIVFPERTRSQSTDTSMYCFASKSIQKSHDLVYYANLIMQYAAIYTIATVRVSVLWLVVSNVSKSCGSVIVTESVDVEMV